MFVIYREKKTVPFASYLQCRSFRHTKSASIEFKIPPINGRLINLVNWPIQWLIATPKPSEQLPVNDFLNIARDGGTTSCNAYTDGVLLHGVRPLQAKPARLQPAQPPEPILYIAGAPFA